MPRTARPTGPLSATDLYPLGAGYIWTYDIDTGTGLNTLGIARVLEASATTFVVQNDGDRSRRTYEVRPDGIFHVEAGSYLIQEPIAVGTEWDATGGRARITAVEQDIDVPAGHFERCITIEKTNETAERAYREVYCPGQGPVIVETIQTMTIGEGLAITATLRAPLQRGDEDVEEPDGYGGPGEE